ncbi:c-type cytochrome [Terracidiphilus gabretensis]|jgi:mono/diheme cytochrome c family protein|uniref:c-type cytochrome n=1 Tax=Terracidiphilus gabretensis TaxID=1577687 RepID=UPI00071BDA59|nr:c-type cytochrome [Terracidiphilus gabretensis]
MSAKTFLSFGLLLSGVIAAFGAAQASSAQEITPRVKQIYKQDCALCHGDTGNGKSELATSMNLVLLDYTDAKSLSGKSDQELFDAIRKGRGDKMPPEEEGRAKDADIRGLVAYVRGLSKGHTGTQTAEAPATPPPGKH